MAKTEKKEKNNKRFLKDFKTELKKVVWPTTKQVINNTTAVVTIVLVTAVIVFALDFTFEALNKYGINQIRAKIESSSSEETNNEVEEISNETTQNEVAEENELEENTAANQ